MSSTLNEYQMNVLANDYRLRRLKKKRHNSNISFLSLDFRLGWFKVYWWNNNLRDMLDPTASSTKNRQPEKHAQKIPIPVN